MTRFRELTAATMALWRFRRPNLNSLNSVMSSEMRALSDVRELVVFDDLHPMHDVYKVMPINAEPYISFRIRVEQGVPVHAAALTRMVFGILAGSIWMLPAADALHQRSPAKKKIGPSRSEKLAEDSDTNSTTPHVFA